MIQEFELGTMLGSGKFGDVFLSRHRASGFLLAVKKIVKSTIRECGMEAQFAAELRIHRALRHPNVVALYGFFEDEYHVFLAMELADEGSLMRCLNAPPAAVAGLLAACLGGVEYLHRQRVAHRDLKPENIVRVLGVPKICDFGWAGLCEDGMRRTFCGTLDYVSPEMKDRGEYGLTVDLWSLGVLTYELLTGRAPFRQEIATWRQAGGRLSSRWSWALRFPPEVPPLARQFIEALLHEDPERRASLAECRSHPFLALADTPTSYPELDSFL